MQEMAQDWADLLWILGGALELSKCSFYSIGWSWNQGKQRMTRYDPGTKISVQNPQGDILPISQKPTSTGIRNLGVHLAPDGNLTDELNHLISKATEIAAGIWRVKYLAEELQKAFYVIFLSRLLYFLAVTYFTKTELDTVMSKFMPWLLNARHFPKTFPRAVVYAPRRIGGIGYTHLFYVQGYRQVLLVIGLLRTKSDLSTLFCINLEIFRLNAGFSCCPLANPRKLLFLTPSWFVSVCEYLLECQCSLSTENPPYFAPKCVHNENIMDVLERNNLSKRWLEVSNRCRIFLQAITISDIADATGTKILESAIHCRYRLPSSLRWPIQVLPSKRDRSIWKKCLMKYFLGDSRFRLLQQPLGRWFTEPLVHHRQWDTGISINDSKVFHRNRHGWRCYSIAAIYKGYCIRHHQHHRSIPPDFLIPAEISPISEETIFYRGCTTSYFPSPSCKPSHPQFSWQPRNSDQTKVFIHLHKDYAQCHICLPDQSGATCIRTPGRQIRHCA